MKKQIVVGLLISTLCSSGAGCSPERPIGTQVHEGPAPSSGGACFAAVDAEGRMAWVRPDGRTGAGPYVGQILAMAFDRARDGLLVTTSEKIWFVPAGAAKAEDRGSSAGSRAAWPIAGGLLLEGELGAWTHRDPSGTETRRILPRALSLWERPAAGVVEWLGVEHPRHAGLVLVRGDAQAPLARPELFEPPDEMAEMRGALRAAPGPGDDVIFAHIADSELHISGVYTGEFLPIEAPLGAQRLSSAVWLGGADYLFSAEEPDSVFRMDLETSNIEHLEGLQGPIAGPVPCHAMISLP